MMTIKVSHFVAKLCHSARPSFLIETSGQSHRLLQTGRVYKIDRCLRLYLMVL